MQQTVVWTVIFFAFAAASPACLAIGEVFTLEVRAIAIRFSYAVRAAPGGVCGPAVSGRLIESGSRD